MNGGAVGESSSAAKVPQGPGVDLADPKTGEKGPALFSIGALIAVMLGRCRTARCAIATAGALAEEHGFYGEGWGSGESLTVRRLPPRASHLYALHFRRRSLHLSSGVRVLMSVCMRHVKEVVYG